jgi:hypothetical protein
MWKCSWQGNGLVGRFTVKLSKQVQSKGKGERGFKTERLVMKVKREIVLL